MLLLTSKRIFTYLVTDIDRSLPIHAYFRRHRASETMLARFQARRLPVSPLPAPEVLIRRWLPIMQTLPISTQKVRKVHTRAQRLVKCT